MRQYPGVAKLARSDGSVCWQVRATYVTRSNERKTFTARFDTQTEAVAARAAWLDLQHQQDTPQGPTLTSLAETWLRLKLPSLATKTQAHYQRTVAKHLNTAPFAGKPITQVTPSEIHAHLQTLNGARSRGFAQQRLSQILAHARASGLLSTDLLATLPRTPQQKSHKGQALNPEQLSAFLQVEQHSFYHPLFLLMAGTGLRISEAIGLRWQDLDPTNKTLSVRQIVSMPNGVPEVQKGRAKNQSSLRILALDETLTQALLALPHHPATDLIFASARGNPLNANNLQRHFKQLLRKANVPTTYRIHDLRHTATTYLLHAGVPTAVVAQRGGYSSARTLMDTYNHALAIGQQQAVAAMTEFLKGPTT